MEYEDFPNLKSVSSIGKKNDVTIQLALEQKGHTLTSLHFGQGISSDRLTTIMAC